MSDSVRPHRRQPTRLPCPWDSPGKNTGVGCHFLLQCMKVKSESAVAQSCPTPSDPLDCSLPGPSIHGIFQARVLEWGAIDFSIYSHAFILKLKPHLQGTVFWHSSFISDESLGAPGISSKTEVLAKRQQIKRSKYSHQHFICLLTGSPVHLGLSNGNKDADEGMCIKRERCS